MILGVLLSLMGGQPLDHIFQGGDAARINLLSMVGFEMDHYRWFDYRHAAIVEVREESDKERINWRLGPWFEIRH